LQASDFSNLLAEIHACGANMAAPRALSLFELLSLSIGGKASKGAF
jgi:hypothetical protein